MWEDDKNKNGGRWLINSNRNQRSELDRIWLETVNILIFCLNILQLVLEYWYNYHKDRKKSF